MKDTQKRLLAACLVLLLSFGLISTGAAQEQAAPFAEIPPLKDVYKDDFLFGTIYGPESTKGMAREIIQYHFNVITPANIMKPVYVQILEGVYDFTKTDALMAFAEENGLPVVGHTLVWYQQSGKWMGKDVTREEAIEQMRSHIYAVAGRYKGRMLSWDVVNEAILDGAVLPENGDWKQCLRPCQWLDAIGPDYVELAFQFAAEADPNAVLYYNDYALNYWNKAEIVCAMVEDFKARGIPIGGIGMQGHYGVGVDINTVAASLERFSELGVEISITELDIGIPNVEVSYLTQEQETAQAVTYAELFSLFRSYRDVIARVTLWGAIDSKSWIATQFPCPFRGDYTPKEAAWAIVDPDAYVQ